MQQQQQRTHHYSHIPQKRNSDNPREQSIDQRVIDDTQRIRQNPPLLLAQQQHPQPQSQSQLQPQQRKHHHASKRYSSSQSPPQPRQHKEQPSPPQQLHQQPPQQPPEVTIELPPVPQTPTARPRSSSCSAAIPQNESHEHRLVTSGSDSVFPITILVQVLPQ